MCVCVCFVLMSWVTDGKPCSKILLQRDTVRRDNLQTTDDDANTGLFIVKWAEIVTV